MMWLDLKSVIEVPGAELPFTCTLEQEQLDFPFIKTFLEPPQGSGTVKNTAGILSLAGKTDLRIVCICDRCGREFERHDIRDYTVTLSAVPDSEDEGEVFPLTADGIDPGEVLTVCRVLDMDTKCLCRPDCLGLCPVCGKDLNDGPCRCLKPRDPRLAALESLLEDGED